MDNLELQKAEKHIKNAWIAGAFSTSITLIFSFTGAFSENFRFAHGYDTWNLLDVAFLAGLTYGIYKKNRFCALGLLIYFIISKFALLASNGQFTGGLLSLIFVYFYFQGTRAAFKIHKQKIENGEINKKLRKKGFGYYVGFSFLGLFIIGLIFLLIIGSLAPETEVIPGKQINKRYLNFLWDQEIVERSENIQYWYSDAFGDFKNGFYLFTNKKVVVYSQNWEEPAIIVPYSDIIDIEFERDESFIVDSRITLILNDSSTVFFPVSSENDGDKKYHDILVKMWRNKR